METLFGFLAEYAAELGGGAAVIAIVETIFKPFRRLFSRTETVKLDEDTKAAIAPVKAEDGPALTIPEFIRLRRELKADLEALLDRCGNEIGGDRINEAKAALEQGDNSKAKEIFEKIKARS